jgi:hypothetical protein
MDTTQTVTLPFVSNRPTSISVLGVDADGMTTFVYFEPPDTLLGASTPFIGMELPS